MIENIPGCNCTGCSACVNICPVSAIKLLADERGFAVPQVNNETCIKCKKCLSICPSLSPLEDASYCEPIVYAAWNKDEKIRMESTSGGVFSALADAVISRGGYVVGAEYDDTFGVHHTIIDRKNLIAKQRQSKYTQSDLGTIFHDIKMLLEKDQLILFCGTPCQSVGLQKYLSKKYENLFCCDFICRGVTSPKVYKKFLHDNSPSNTTLQKVHFKNKDFGWNRFSTKLTFENGCIYQKDRNDDYYMRGYLKHNLYLRNCCSQCDYKTLPRKSDISLGDFWGIGKYDASLDNEQGTSVVLVNSEKGRTLLAWAEQQLFITTRSLDEVLAGNSCLLHPVVHGEYRDLFFEKMDKFSFNRIIELIDEKTLKLSYKDKFRRELLRIKHYFKGKSNK